MSSSPSPRASFPPISAVLVMLAMAEAIAGFVDRHPTVKVLALAFLLLIGTSLVTEGLDQHLPKGYIYFAMAFSVFVELLNMRVRTRAQPPVHLRSGYIATGTQETTAH